MIRRNSAALNIGLSLAFFGATVFGGEYAYDSIELETEGHAILETSPAPPLPPLEGYQSLRAGKTATSRFLTEGEKRLAHALFGPSFKTDAVALHFYSAQRDDFLSDTPSSSRPDVEFYGTKYWSTDYSQDQDGVNFNAFIYEMTHIWQVQMGNRWHHGDVAGDGYPLASNFLFDDYGPDQQRAIVSDYASRFLHSSRRSRVLPSQYGSDRSDTDPFLEQLVEDKFSGAKALRLSDMQVRRRHLTQGEIELVNSIFGPVMHAEKIEAAFHPEAFGDILAWVDRDSGADFWGDQQASNDFSQDSNDNFGNFVHEMTHVWQRATGWSHTQNQVARQYFYPLDPQWTFKDYSIEQQAAMVEDYARYFLHPDHRTRWLQDTYKEDELQEKLPMLQKMVENEFPLAGQARLKAAAHNRGGLSPQVN